MFGKLCFYNLLHNKTYKFPQQHQQQLQQQQQLSQNNNKNIPNIVWSTVHKHIPAFAVWQKGLIDQCCTLYFIKQP
jgi:hypothetical protein